MSVNSNPTASQPSMKKLTVSKLTFTFEYLQGKLIHEQNMKSKISFQAPFKHRSLINSTES
jgi:hypothetical protein